MAKGRKQTTATGEEKRVRRQTARKLVFGIFNGMFSAVVLLPSISLPHLVFVQ